MGRIDVAALAAVEIEARAESLPEVLRLLEVGPAEEEQRLLVRRQSQYRVAGTHTLTNSGIGGGARGGHGDRPAGHGQ
jgi:hypothetical protein